MKTSVNKNFLTSLIAITTIMVAAPALAILNDSSNPIRQAVAITPVEPSLAGSANPTQSAEAATPATNSESKNLGQKIVGGVKSGANAVAKGASNAWNATSNFVSGVFKGAEPCSDTAANALKANDTNIEQTKLDTKQSGTDGKENAAGKCVVSKCKKGWVVNDAKNGCIQSEGDCTEAAKKQDTNATAGELKKTVCYITECGNGYHPSDDGKSCEQAELSEKDSKQKVADLKDNAQKMKDKEQSTANKLLGAAAIGATGIGGMNLMTGLSEQKADDAAEEDMKAYLATFICDYGQGRNIKGGETSVDLPGGNELFAQVNEYKALAADLKVRKEALGKTPGIEAEVIYDIAETGLYDNVGMGRQSGAYASVSRALMDENSADAAAWEKQKQDAHDKKNQGLLIAGIGAAAGLAGNLAINSGEKNKNQVDKINKKYKNKALGIVETKVNNAAPHTVTCPDGKTVRSDNLTCTCAANQQYNPNQNTCDACTGGQVSDGTNKCECPADKPLWDSKNKICITNPATCISQCKPTEGDHLQLLADGCTCTCENGYDFVAKTADTEARCVCKEPKTENAETGMCEIVRTEIQTAKTSPTFETISLSAINMFEIGKYTIATNSTIESDLTTMYKAFDKNQTCKLFIQGYTDPVGSDNSNQTLAGKRANTILTLMQKIINTDTSSDKPDIEISAQGMGEISCTCGIATKMEIDVSAKSNDRDYQICYDSATQTVKPADTIITGNDRFAPCRRIEVTTNCTSTRQVQQ